ncbi:MAG: hypothetical protein ACJLTB_19270 [Algoriphagus aquaeductus]|uniref:hypothetical protein n=1 Tax=Algoriphagus aquaeductus TaxID=475299 RepID=UPI0038797DD2
MKKETLILFLLIFGLGKVGMAQKTDPDKKSDPDSSGVVSSVLLPTVAPLLLFDEEKVKEEKKRKRKTPGKTSGLESKP